jgi:alpha-amylase
MRKIAEKCYLPTNKLMLELVKEYGCKFKIAYSISGTALDQLEMYAPDVLDSFKKLAETGCVEFLAETNSHSLSSLKNREEFVKQVNAHAQKIEELFGQKPTAFRNTELIYSDEIGATIADLGYKAMLTEGAKHILGWKSSNYLYTNAINPKLKLLLKNFQLSDDIAFRFSNRSWSEWPLTTEKYVNWLNNVDHKDEVVNIFIDYESFGERHSPDSGIFDFLRALPGRILSDTKFEFLTPTEAARKHQPIAPLHVPSPISWADEERDLTAWLGNEMQNEAFKNLYEVSQKVDKIDDPIIQRDWRYLQTSNHLYYISTKWFSDGDVHKYFTPYDSPYEAFINYMNALSDFRLRVENSSTTGLTGSVNEPKPEEVDFLIADYEAKLKELKAIKTKVAPKKKASVSKKAPVKKATTTAKKVSTSSRTTKLLAVKKGSTKKN